MFGVSSLVRADEDHTVLVLEITRADDDVDQSSISQYPSEDPQLTPSLGIINGGASDVRLLDLDRPQAWYPVNGAATTADGFTDNFAMKALPGETIYSYLRYGAVEADSVTVYVPHAGFATVPVVDRDAAGDAGVDLATVESVLNNTLSANEVDLPPALIEEFTLPLTDAPDPEAVGTGPTATVDSPSLSTMSPATTDSSWEPSPSPQAPAAPVKAYP